MCVGFYELVYSESISGFVWGNDAYVVAHKLVLAVGFLSGSLKDGLWLKKRLNSVDAKFATHAGLFESAERCLLVVWPAIDRNPAGLDLRCDSTDALNVSPTHVSVEAVLRIVGDPDCIFFVLVGDDREDGPENLFLGNRHVILHIDKYRRFHEVTRLKAGRVSFASDEHVCAFFNALANVCLHTLILLLVHHGSDGSFWIGRIADWKGGNSIDDRLFDFVEATLRHKKPGPRDASLTIVQKPYDERARDGLLEVGIIKQNVGRLAAQLKRDPLHRRSTVTHDRSSDGGRPGKGNLGHVGIPHEFRSDDFSPTRDNVAKPFRKFRLVYTFQPHARLQSAQLARLHDHRATGSDCRGKFHAKEKHVCVPRRNQTGNADRLHGDRCLAPTPSQRQLVECPLGRKEHVGARLHDGPCEPHHTAILLDHGLGEISDARRDRLVQPP